MTPLYFENMGALNKRQSQVDLSKTILLSASLRSHNTKHSSQFRVYTPLLMNKRKINYLLFGQN